MLGLLIRHGHSEAVGQWLAGRRPGVALSETGRREAETLAIAFRWLPIAAVYSSPLERAVDTATPLARDHGLPVDIREALTDIDFGTWTGRSLTDLAGEPAWIAFNGDRRHACAPAGESLLDVQRRVVADLMTLSGKHQGHVVAIVTHAEPIRCAIAAFDHAPLDDVVGVDVAPAHVSTVGLGPQFRRVLAINRRAELIAV